MVDLHFCLGRKINTLPRYWHLFLSGVMAYILRLASLTSKELVYISPAIGQGISRSK